MKNSINYVLFILVFIALVFSVTFKTIYTRYKDQGVFELKRNNCDVVFTNVIINNTDDIKVKINNTNKSIHIEANNIKDKIEFSVDLKNIGNIDAIIKNYSITNIDTNGDKDNFSINVSLGQNQIIKGSQSAKLIVSIENKGKNQEELYYNFNLNYIFEEDNL